MKDTVKEIARQWFMPSTLLLSLLGVNSILDSSTTFSFNVERQIIQIPIPALGTTVGWMLLSLPMIMLIRPLLSKLSGVGETSLPTDIQDAGETKKRRFSWLLDLLLYLRLPHK